MSERGVRLYGIATGLHVGGWALFLVWVALTHWSTGAALAFDAACLGVALSMSAGHALAWSRLRSRPEGARSIAMATAVVAVCLALGLLGTSLVWFIALGYTHDVWLKLTMSAALPLLLASEVTYVRAGLAFGRAGRA